MTDESSPPAKEGNPTIYSQEMADAICLRIMEGGTVRKICTEPGMPARSTVHMWVQTNKPFALQYDNACKIRREIWAEEIIDIADTTEMGEVMKDGPNGKEIRTGDMVQHRHLRVESRKWILARTDARFGDRVRQEHSGPDGKPIEFSAMSLSDEERASRVAALLTAAEKRKKDEEAGGGTGSPPA
jgi:hypothetical protein